MHLLVTLLLALSAFRASKAFTNPALVPHLPQQTKRWNKDTILHMSNPTPLDTLTSGLASMARLQNGVTVLPDIKAPEIVIRKLYDVESCPKCRLVRERITELDLVVEKVVPACENSRVWKNELPLGTEIPCMVVDSRGEEKVLKGVEDIVPFLDQSYLDELPPPAGETWTSNLASILRSGRGSRVCENAVSENTPRPSKTLVFYNYEGNQFCRLVRETLTELDLEYELRSVGKLSPRRQELASISANGSTQCPHLVDPNTGASMKESKDITEYLFKNYSS